MEAQLLGALPHLPSTFGPAADGKYHGAQSHALERTAVRVFLTIAAGHRTPPATLNRHTALARERPPTPSSVRLPLRLIRATHRTPVRTGAGRWARD
ncbi:hypothetical protein HEK616_68970 [Streptomyces nigrescens]|uniref:Uncharacterized protein n=1 Tax=Streptomyces nigrescens TaxID=1920 RepID=A0ABN6R758_STRNI|nr:hypothetical protein HEK616_68970 [Streptomyces nigrescens]